MKYAIHSPSTGPYAGRHVLMRGGQIVGSYDTRGQAISGELEHRKAQLRSPRKAGSLANLYSLKLTTKPQLDARKRLGKIGWSLRYAPEGYYASPKRTAVYTAPKQGPFPSMESLTTFIRAAEEAHKQRTAGERDAKAKGKLLKQLGGPELEMMIDGLPVVFDIKRATDGMGNDYWTIRGRVLRPVDRGPAFMPHPTLGIQPAERSGKSKGIAIKRIRATVAKMKRLGQKEVRDSLRAVQKKQRELDRKQLQLVKEARKKTQDPAKVEKLSAEHRALVKEFHDLYERWKMLQSRAASVGWK